MDADIEDYESEGDDVEGEDLAAEDFEINTDDEEDEDDKDESIYPKTRILSIVVPIGFQTKQMSVLSKLPPIGL